VNYTENLGLKGQLYITLNVMQEMCIVVIWSIVGRSANFTIY